MNSTADVEMEDASFNIDHAVAKFYQTNYFGGQ